MCRRNINGLVCRVGVGGTGTSTSLCSCLAYTFADKDTCICETIPCIYGVSSRQLVLERRTALILYNATLGRVVGNKVRSLLLCCCLTR